MVGNLIIFFVVSFCSRSSSVILFSMFVSFIECCVLEMILFVEGLFIDIVLCKLLLCMFMFVCVVLVFVYISRTSCVKKL